MKSQFNDNVNDIQTQTPYAERVQKLIEDKINRKGAPLTAFVQTFGCQQNEADSEKIMGTAKLLGYEKADDLTSADLVIFNTCAVREHAELRALSKTGQLKHLKAKNPDLLIGLWGCMVSQQHRKEDIKHKYPYVDFVAGTNMLHRLPEILCDVMVNNRRRFYVDDTPHAIVEGVSSLRDNDIKAWLSVMYGCDNFCTYCVVPHVRGRERSRTVESVLAEAQDIIGSGFREITLLGQNVNSYGKTLPDSEQIGFAKLLQKVCDIEGDFWVRFMTSHPKDASDELIEVMAKNKKVAKHFHLPIQAGSNAVLKAMNRRYTREEFLSLAMKIKNKIPDITLTTDIICGFPGETESDFIETLEMLETIKFDSIYSFLYSPRKGTPAADMKEQLTHEEKTERFSKLLELQQRISEKKNAEMLGKTCRVLVDTKREAETGLVSGRTEGNKAVRFAAENDELYGRFVEVKILQSAHSGLIGKLI